MDAHEEYESTGRSARGRLSRRRLLIGTGAAFAAYGLDRLLLGGETRPAPTVSVRDLGARGNGRSNDTRAFQRASLAIERAGGGTLEIPPGTYIVGEQIFAGSGGKGYAYRGSSVISLSNCRRPVLIEGRGATLRTAPGLRLGSFSPSTGTRYEPPALPFIEPDFSAQIYEGAIFLQSNHTVRVRGIDVDGNARRVIFGGQYGDSGYQRAHDGLVAIGNGALVVEDSHFHHHGRDGVILIDPGRTPDDAARPVFLSNVASEYNTRQGLSWTGGRGLQALNCSFSYTGQGGTPPSPPGAGVDIEPEVSTCRAGRFANCRFVGNRAFGVIAALGDSADIQFDGCMFWSPAPSPNSSGPRALWPDRPRMRFSDCRVYGSVVHTFGSASVADACQFKRCTFEDRVHPRYGRPYVGLALIETTGANVGFAGCDVTAWSGRSVAISGTSGAPMRVDRCRVVHRDAAIPAGSYQASLAEVRLAHTQFAEVGLTEPYFIAATDVILGAGVSVDGPHVAWDSVGGGVGRI